MLEVNEGYAGGELLGFEQHFFHLLFFDFPEYFPVFVNLYMVLYFLAGNMQYSVAFTIS
jgi:hypothetical protein